MQVSRQWDVHEHPKWLVFEMENGIQIRSQQYVVAKVLMDNPEAMVQLNMGEGKTRVIMPLLLLFWKRNFIQFQLVFFKELVTR